MTKFSKHKWWTLRRWSPLVAIAAGVPNVFAPNTVISSSLVNANFANLADRVTALEAASAKSSATVLSGSIGSITPKTVTFMATGANSVLLIISASAYSGTGGSTLDVAIQFDGQIIGHLLGYTNEASSHKDLIVGTFSVPTPAAGTHTIGILPFAGTGTITDANDHFSVTAVELH
jgi:hypothetical protein